MDWVAVAAIASPFVTGAGLIVMRSEARSVAKEVVADAVALALAQFKNQLLEDMNGKYLRTREQLICNENYERRLDDTEDRIHELERKEAPKHRHPDYDRQFEEHQANIDKLALDMRNMSGSLARRTANSQ